MAGCKYCIAPLDLTSIINGYLKWEHSYASIRISEYDELISWLDMMYGSLLDLDPQWSLERAREEINEDKAAGPPYNDLIGRSKGEVLNKMTDQELLDDFKNFSHYCNATLKDELREKSKDARLFIPANVVMVFVGLYLFGAQNDAIMEAHCEKPIKIGMQTPGREAANFWKKVKMSEGEYHQYDGVQSDAHFSSEVACIIRDFRKKHLHKKFHKMVDRYYAMTYNMDVNFCGAIVELVGQQTGQTNTATDNSLGYLIVLMLHAIRNKVSYFDFEDMFTAVMGDDMLLVDNLGCFGPMELETTFNSLGMYIEAPAVSEEFYDLTFVGMHPERREVAGQMYDLYSYRLERLWESQNFMQKAATPSDRLQKLISLSTLIFGNKSQFERMREIAFNYAKEARHCLTYQDISQLGMLDDTWQLNLHSGFEPSRFRGF